MSPELPEHSHSCLRRLIRLWVVACAMAAAQVLTAAEWQPDRLLVAGSDERVWVVSASAAEGDKLPEVRFWFAALDDQSGGHSTPAPSRFLPPVQT